jgi:DNA repair exonuclease SbcCD ATPase subunit
LEAQLTTAAEAAQKTAKELSDLNERLKAVDAELLELTDSQMKLRKYEDSQKSRAAVEEAKKLLQAAQLREHQANEELNSAEIQLAQRAQAMDGLKDVNQSYTQELASLLAARDRYNRITLQLKALKDSITEDKPVLDESFMPRLAALEQNISRFKSMLAGATPLPSLPEDVELQTQWEETSQRLKSLSSSEDPRLPVIKADIARLAHYLETFATGVCPTCSQSIKDFNPTKLTAELNEVKARQKEILQAYSKRLQELKAREAELVVAIKARAEAAKGAVRNALSKYEIEYKDTKQVVDEWEAKSRKWELVTSQIAALQEEANNLPEVNSSRIEQLQASLAEYKKLEELYQDAVNNKKVKQAALIGVVAEVSRQEKFCSSLANSVEEYQLTDQEISDARTKAELVSARTISQRDLQAQIGVATAKLTQYQVMVDQFNLKMKEEAISAKWNSLCSRARDVLNVNALPALMMREYAARLNRRIAYYMQIWESPFQVYLDDNLSFIAKFPDGTQLAAARLSGGQKIVASTSFRLAMSDTFARSVGLLILDEPTNHLDKSNIVHLQQLLVKLKLLAGSMGRQIVVVTHEESLTGFFDHTIQLWKA